jgi:hypothetical protein
MKTIFKPLGLAAAVAAVSAGYAGVAGATDRAAGNLGDLAIVPYYTVQTDWVTGVHIINSSPKTQVVKLRIRRGSDSADALDFNLIMSPYDEWTGFLNNDTNDAIFWSTDDNTCTAPLRADGRFEMPDIFREGADEGYIEIISMGSPTNEGQPIATAAKHDADGVPFDCASVASNFKANGLEDIKPGINSSSRSYQAVTDAKFYINALYDDLDRDCGVDEGAGLCVNDYEDGGNALKVSYFFRDTNRGTEFGANAVHIANFSDDESWMSNQEFGLLSGDTGGFDYPDLNGGVLKYGDTRGLFNELRSPAVLGVTSILNDWSVNQTLNVSTDWVVTMPGQYTMIDYVVAANYGIANCGKADNPAAAGDDGVPLCDFRDIPVVAVARVWDREEGEITPEDGDLVISPAPPGEVTSVIFPYEVNVIEFGAAGSEPVLDSEYVVAGIDPFGDFGWAQMSVLPTAKQNTDTDNASPAGQAVCEYVPVPLINAVKYPATSTPVGDQVWIESGVATNTTRVDVCEAAIDRVPVIGFVAWDRNFPQQPLATYGRLIQHSFTSGS